VKISFSTIFFQITKMYSWYDVAERTVVVYKLALAKHRSQKMTLRDRAEVFSTVGPVCGKVKE
jgi:hypothetical protein